MAHYAMLIDLNTCTGCNACMAACAVENQTPFWSDKWRTKVHDITKGKTDADTARIFFPRLCNHCDNPPCVTVCPTGATYKMDNGIVDVDDDMCMGCQACTLACPYDERYALDYDDNTEKKAVFGEETLKKTRPGVDKCNFCRDRVEDNRLPACVETCVGNARQFADLDNPNDPVTQLINSGIAEPLMAHLGTKPNVYYIPVKKQTIHYERDMFNGQNSEGGLHPVGGENGTTFERKQAAESGQTEPAHEQAMFDVNSPFANSSDAQMTDLLKVEA
ncbi:4Fe-4S dicluster domain-containing protein [Thiomicrorhabdus sp. Milos-T2]|uniref:4Fe-4S dicluster domain-containing protein n=1 Tax=Thiomicrorhabdus sp. Milos-T2 TaxID=90814 RepID=UPI000A04C67A|nr:4Fe-4S dicluster domain-containing protein [Thiomicrorhabdus sp. Milos-T2]